MLWCAVAAAAAVVRAYTGPAAAVIAAAAAVAAAMPRPVLLDDRGSFENFALGRGELCASGRGQPSRRNYRCLKGSDHGQTGLTGSTVVAYPEPVRSGKHSLRSGPFNFSQGYRVEVIPVNRSEPSEGDVIEGFGGPPAWYGFSVFLPTNYSADELSSPDRIFQWHGDSRLPSGEQYRCNVNPVLTFEVLGPYVTLVQKMQTRGYHSPRPAPPPNGSAAPFAVPLFHGGAGALPCGPNPPPGSCTCHDGRCAAKGRLDQFLHGWYSNTSCSVLGPLDAWRGGWTDVVVRAVWNYNETSHAPQQRLTSDGQLDVWLNGTRVFSRSGSNCFNDFGAPFAKFGIYKYPWKTTPSPSSPGGARVGPVKSRVAWHDEVYECREAEGGGCGYDAVQAKPVVHQRVDDPLPNLPTCST
jgi:hypothetical protein